MIDILPRVIQMFPDHSVESTYTACLPVYNLRVVVKGLVRHDLSYLAQNILRAVDLGFVRMPDIAYVLGLDEDDLARAGAELLGATLVEQFAVGVANRRDLRLTPKGKEHLRLHLDLTVPEKRSYTLHYSPLSKVLLPQQDKTLSTPDVRRNAEFALPSDGRSPGVSDLKLEDVKNVLSDSDKVDFEVTSVVGIERCYLEYVPAVRGFVLRDKQTGEERIELFRGSNHLKAESASLAQLKAEGGVVVPVDAQLAQSGEVDLKGLVGERSARLIAKQIAVDEQIFVKQQDLEFRRELLRSTQDVRDIEALQHRLGDIERELADAQCEKQRLLDYFEKYKKEDSPTLIATESHRDILKQALKEAKVQLSIICPWMTRRAVDAELVALFRDCLIRGVIVKLGWGMPNATPQELDRNRSIVDSIGRDLRVGLTKDQVSRLTIDEIGWTHEKLLLCDSTFGVVTSFNWLSYRGDSDAQIRRETGVVLRSPGAMAELAAWVNQGFDSSRSGNHRSAVAAR